MLCCLASRPLAVADVVLQQRIGKAKDRRLVPVGVVLAGCRYGIKAGVGVPQFRQCWKRRWRVVPGITLDHHHGREEQPLCRKRDHHA